MILLSDANILIDLGYVDGLEMLTKIASTEVLDVVLQECEDERQPGLPAAVIAAGVQVIETQASWLSEAAHYKSAELSFQAQLNIYYAKSGGAESCDGWGRVVGVWEPSEKRRPYFELTTELELWTLISLGFQRGTYGRVRSGLRCRLGRHWESFHGQY